MHMHVHVHDSRMNMHVHVHFMTMTFSYVHVSSKEEVREDGRKGLIAPPADNVMGWDAQSRELPDFSSMLGYLHKRVRPHPNFHSYT